MLVSRLGDRATSGTVRAHVHRGIARCVKFRYSTKHLPSGIGYTIIREVRERHLNRQETARKSHKALVRTYRTYREAV